MRYALLLLFVMVGGCRSADPAGGPDDPSVHPPGIGSPPPQTAGPVTYFPQFRDPADVSMQALTSGVLEVRNGCLFIGERLVLWPSGARLALDARGVPVVNGELRAGERIEIGGGTAPEGFSDAALVQPIPPRCRAPMWIAAG